MKTTQEAFISLDNIKQLYAEEHEKLVTAQHSLRDRQAELENILMKGDWDFFENSQIEQSHENFSNTEE